MMRLGVMVFGTVLGVFGHGWLEIAGITMVIVIVVEGFAEGGHRAEG